VRKSTPIIICALLTILFSLPSILKISTVLPFLDAEVRAKAPIAIQNLRKEGVWLVNTKLISITREEDKTCFHFDHKYTKRNPGFLIPDSKALTTCI